MIARVVLNTISFSKTSFQKSNTTYDILDGYGYFTAGTKNKRI